MPEDFSIGALTAPTDEPEDFSIGEVKEPKPKKFDLNDSISRHAQRTGLDPNLIHAIINQESGGNPRALSEKGAQGLMQLMPDTATRFGVRDRKDPEQNIQGGTSYLKFLSDRYKGDFDRVVRAYHQGEGNEDAGRSGPKTRNYLHAIKSKVQPQEDFRVGSIEEDFSNDTQVAGRPPTERFSSPNSQPSVDPATSLNPFRTGFHQAQTALNRSKSAFSMSPRPVGISTNDISWHYGMTPEEFQGLSQKQQQQVISNSRRAIAIDEQKKAQGVTLQPSLDYINANRKSIGLSPKSFAHRGLPTASTEQQQSNAYDLMPLMKKLAATYEGPGVPIEKGLEQLREENEYAQLRNSAGDVPIGLRIPAQEFHRLLAKVERGFAGLADYAERIPHPGRSEADAKNSLTSEISEYLKRRASLHESVGNLETEDIKNSLPRTAAKAFTDAGVDLASLLAITKATGLSFPVVMAGESALNNSDKPADVIATEASKAYLLGRAYEFLPGYVSKKLGVKGQVGTRALGAGLFGTAGAAQSAYQGGDTRHVLAGGISQGVFGALGGPHEKAELKTKEAVAPEIPLQPRSTATPEPVSTPEQYVMDTRTGKIVPLTESRKPSFQEVIFQTGLEGRDTPFIVAVGDAASGVSKRAALNKFKREFAATVRPSEPKPEIPQEAEAVNSEARTALDSLLDSGELSKSQHERAVSKLTEASELTSARKADLEADRRELLDLPEWQPAERKTWQTSLDNAKREGLDSEALRLSSEVLKNPRSLNDEETAGLTLKLAELKNEHKEALASGNGERVNSIEDEFYKVTEALRTSGTEKGRTLAAQKLTINQNYDLVSLLTRAKAKGIEITPKKRVEYTELSNKITDLEGQLAQANEKAALSNIQANLDATKRFKVRAEKRVELDTEFADLKSQFAAEWKRVQKGNVQSAGLAGLDPEGQLTILIGKMTRNRVRAGVNNAADLIDSIHTDLKGYGISRDDIRAEVERALQTSTRDKTRQTQLFKQEAELTRRLEERDFSKSAKREIIYNSETLKLKIRVDKLKAQYETELHNAQLTNGQKFAQYAFDVAMIPKSIMSSADLSAPLRQGMFHTVSHPLISAKAFAESLTGITNLGHAKLRQKIENHSDYKRAERAGVEFTGSDKPNTREEFYISNLTKNLPVIKHSERAFTGFLDIQRLQVFSKLSEGVTDPKALKALASFINIAS